MEDVFLAKGSHESREEGMCAMEFAAYLAGLKHTDRPSCVSPALLYWMIKLNDTLDDEPRQRLRPYIVRTLGTAGDGQDAKRRRMAFKWIVATFPAGGAFESMTIESMTKVIQESAFKLLDRMIDPGGIHDLKTEEQWLEQELAESQGEERVCRIQQ